MTIHLENGREGKEITLSSNTEYNCFYFRYLLPGLAPVYMWVPLAAEMSYTVFLICFCHHLTPPLIPHYSIGIPPGSYCLYHFHI